MEKQDLPSHFMPLRQHEQHSQHADRKRVILCLKLLTDRLRGIHVREIFDVVTSVSSQEHIKDSLGFNYPFFWEKEENRDRKDLNPQYCSKKRFGRGEHSSGS